jgi:predicted permease
MEFLIIFNSSVLPLFIIVAIAFVYNRLVQPDIIAITNMTLTVFAPIFVFDTLVKSRIMLDGLLMPLVCMALLTTALMVVSYLTARLLNATDNERMSLMLASSMINIGNFGLPLIYFTFGSEAVAHSVVYFVAFNVPLSTVAIYISSTEKRVLNILKDIAKIPLFHAMIAALIVSQLSIPVPGVIEKSIGLVGQATIPLLIFILGLQLSRIRIRAGHVRFILPAVVIRLVVSPVMAYLIFKTVGLAGIERHVAVIQTSAPAALLPLMYAIRFNRSSDLLAAMILATTLLSGVSLTVLIRLLT